MKQLLFVIVLFGSLSSCSQRMSFECELEISVPKDMQEVKVKLDSILVEDQKYRIESDKVIEKHGRNSDEMQKHWQLIAKTDACNLKLVELVLDKYGWLGPDSIGYDANQALFLVIQHAQPEVQVKYLPQMRDAVKAGKADPGSLALLEDRVALSQGKKQIYGSQIHIDNETGEYYVAPVVDPENVNKRRAEVGLLPIEEYLKHWNLEWEPEKHDK